MARFANMPINRKLSRVIVMTSAVVLLLTGIAMIAFEFVATRRAMAEDMTVLADLVGRNSAPALSFHRDEDVDDVNKMLSAVQTDPHILSAAVYDRDGRLFGHYARPGVPGDIPGHPPADGLTFFHDKFEVARPIYLDSKRIGTIFVRADLGRIYSQISLHAMIATLVFMTAMLATLAVAPRLRRPIAEPILALAQVARRVGEHKDYSIRAVKRSEDEIGFLTDSFNQMLAEIDAGQRSLQQANQELAQAKDRAESASRAKDQFLAILSHELRTPLTPVLLSVSLLQTRTDLAPDAREMLETVNRQIQLEARLIDDLLDLTRISRGKLQLNLEVADAHQLIRDAVNICCADRTEDVRLELGAQKHTVRADSGRMMQVFWNLLNNAVKFTPVGKTIEVRTENTEDDGIRIQVVDHGAGIAPDVLPRIFLAFQQGDNAFTRTRGGLGLGLAVAKALVESHGGSIAAHSEGLGAGATFTIQLPTILKPAIAIEPAEPAAPARPVHGSLSILLVEDHKGTLDLMTLILRGRGHTVHAAASVKEALDLASRTAIDLVISDVGLPDGTGNDLMRELRQRYGLKGICLSGFGMEDDVARSLDAGFMMHLTKPVDLTRLQSAIQSAASTLSPA